ncbi:hypothetical protein Nepgr_018687 [Nepenthes gracilis]|uniref:CHCH domain-containing protein n=1 Tax=Nepenthes gracilis TaxID=150966 RepID=A0AAD3XUK0_NEPGR|nr:hypothetical protein Nepgr_018687 [Nepenthes gracilis]
MPRRSSGGRSTPAPRASGYTPARNPPQPAASAPPPVVAQGRNGSMLGGLGGVVAEGMAFGTGSAIAHRAADAIMGPRVIQHETVAASAPTPAAAPAQTLNSLGSDACTAQYKAFQDCINSYGGEISRCQFYMDMLSECRKGSTISGF